MGTLTGTIWVDQNGDGVRQEGESPLSGVEVQLMNGAGRVIVTSAETDENGRFTFEKMAPGSYKLRVDARGTDADIPLRLPCWAARKSRAWRSAC